MSSGRQRFFVVRAQNVIRCRADDEDSTWRHVESSSSAKIFFLAYYARKRDSDDAHFETGAIRNRRTGPQTKGKTFFSYRYYCNKYADMTLEPERDNPNDIRMKLAQHVQVAHKMAALSSDWSAPNASSNTEYNILLRKFFVRGDTEHALSLLQVDLVTWPEVDLTFSGKVRKGCLNSYANKRFALLWKKKLQERGCSPPPPPIQDSGGGWSTYISDIKWYQPLLLVPSFCWTYFCELILWHTQTGSQKWFDGQHIANTHGRGSHYGHYGQCSYKFMDVFPIPYVLNSLWLIALSVQVLDSYRRAC